MYPILISYEIDRKQIEEVLLRFGLQRSFEAFTTIEHGSQDHIKYMKWIEHKCSADEIRANCLLYRSRQSAQKAKQPPICAATIGDSDMFDRWMTSVTTVSRENALNHFRSDSVFFRSLSQSRQ